MSNDMVQLTKKDFESSQEVRWCPGCGDYSILAQVQKVMPTLGIPREKFVVVSGIGCSSRFPYYMNTYGFHTIHGRAPAIATGLKHSRPDLSVWVVSGDGDALSIGGNHFIHMLRRNVDVKILVFNNRIYGLTKGQYSPTTLQGTKTKSSPYGSLDAPFNPLQLALGAGATFVARTFDADPQHMQGVLARAAKHKGAAFVEIMQNCVVFNDGTWDPITAKANRDETMVKVENGKPVLFAKGKKGIRLTGPRPEVVTLGENGITEKDVVVWDEHFDIAKSFAFTQIMPPLPFPVGVFRDVQQPVYHELEAAQKQQVTEKLGKGSLEKLLHGGDTWDVK